MDHFRCDSGQCVHTGTVCDFTLDCVDGSDESPSLCGMYVMYFQYCGIFHYIGSTLLHSMPMGSRVAYSMTYGQYAGMWTVVPVVESYTVKPVFKTT